ncbi:MAG TPA: catalase family peroxidase [Polyangia bacterium]|nr:catalase family peroxidase [Polyangia bacterium]
METKGTEESFAARIVDAINGVFGAQQRNRAIHAKGIVLDATFTPHPGARELSRAPHLQRESTHVTVRFSDFSGNPDVDDADANARPHGMALKFHLADGVDTDILAHSYNGFPVATSEELREMFLALAGSGADATHPTAAERFLSAHPRARAFFEAPKPPPVSFGTLAYFGVSSFAFRNAGGGVAVGRYRLEPGAGEQLLSAEEVARADPDYLRRELRARLVQAPLRFTLLVQLAAPGDRIDDPSEVWPETRPLVELGLLEIYEVVADSETVEQQLVFAPGAVTDGIEPVDPMTAVRDEAYGVSYERRRRR